MIAHFSIRTKAFGPDTLYKDLDIKIQAGEKVGLIGRNGVGKSTLFNIISGLDDDYDGQINLRKGLIVVASRQEHHEFEEKLVIDYIANDLPEYTKLKHILDTYPDRMAEDSKLLQHYSDALERFTQLGYFNVEGDVERALSTYQIPAAKIQGKIGELSGGQKRLVELVKVQRANADLLLIDEPTNHMDYVAKDSFLQWLKTTKDAVVSITHDRDLLGAVDRIIEIRDGKAYEFKGNYDAYLSQNSDRISAGLNEYQVTKQRIKNLQENIIRFRRLKERARDPGTIAQFKRLQEQAQDELEVLSAKEKPSFWIDQESVKNLKTKISDAYDEHKTQNIKIRTKAANDNSSHKLIGVDNLSLGYVEPLFKGITFTLSEGERLEIKGRNGVGKTTIVQAILSANSSSDFKATVFDGHINLDKLARIGTYEQELANSFMQITLADAIEQTYRAKGLDVTDQLVMRLMSDYLFNPHADADKPVSKLSGGQKARLQLISMLAGDPNMLILDEPTNHLDLPSIEELEGALKNYHGAIIYISHDSYFCEKLGGQVIEIKK